MRVVVFRTEITRLFKVQALLKRNMRDINHCNCHTELKTPQFQFPVSGTKSGSLELRNIVERTQERFWPSIAWMQLWVLGGRKYRKRRPCNFSCTRVNNPEETEIKRDKQILWLMSTSVLSQRLQCSGFRELHEQKVKPFSAKIEN